VLQFIEVCLLYLLALYPQVSKGLLLRAVVEHFHQHGDPYSKSLSLVEPEGFPECVGAIVAPQVNLAAPFLYQIIEVWCGELLSLSLSTLER